MKVTMKFVKKLSTLAVTAVLGMMTAASAMAVDVSTWAELRTALTSTTDDQKIKLTADVTASGSGSSSRVIALGSRSYELDLNGHTITAYSNSRLFTSAYGTMSLTIKDSATGGALVGNGAVASGNGGLVQLNNGTLTLEGGAIRNASVSGGHGGAIYVGANGAFVMDGGAISNCTATGSTRKGGAVYAAGRVTVSGGEIANCSAADNGGGVYILDNHMKMTGGVIRDCAATGAEAKGGAIEVKGTGGADSASVTVTGGAFLNNTHMAGTANDFDVSSQGGDMYLYGLVSTTEPNEAFVVNNAQVKYETVAVGKFYVVASEDSATVSENKLTEGIFTFDPSAYAAVAPVIDTTLYRADEKGTDAVGNPLWKINPNVVIEQVTVIPAELEHATAEVYEDGMLVAGPPYVVDTNATVKIVYTAERGYMFEGGSLTMEYETTATTQPTADTTSYVIRQKQAAKIGETVYPYLTDAFAAAQDGDTIVMVGDDNVEETITNGAFAVTLDLAGRTVTGAAGQRMFVCDNAATDFTITNSVKGVGKFAGDISGKAVAGNGGFVLVTAGKVTLAGGCISGWVCTGAGKGGGAAVFVDAEGAFVMNGGRIEDCRVTDTSGRGGAIHAAGSVTMNGGTIANCSCPNNGGGIYVVESHMKMTGGVIRDCAATGADAKGGAIEVKSGTAEGTEASVTITGGAFSGNTAEGVANDFDISTQGGNIYLYGLASTTEPNAEWVVSNEVVQYETVAVGDCFVVAATGTVEVAEDKMKAGTFTFDPTAYVTVLPIIDTYYYRATEDGEDAEGHQLWKIEDNVHTITTAADPAEGGTTAGDGEYVVGSPATLTATANPGYRFFHWQDGNVENPRTVTMAAKDETYTATFRWILVDVTPATVANATAKVYTNGVEVTGDPIRVETNATVKIVYTAANGYAFDITGKTAVETTLTADVNPLEDTTTTATTFLKVVKYYTYYLPSLKAAVEKAVADGDTEFYPELLANSEGDGIYIPEGTFSDGYVFEFGGYSYTITNAVKATGTSGTDGFYLGSSGGFRGPGTISCTADSGVKTLVNNNNSGELSLGGLTLDGRNMHKAGEKCIVLSNSCTDQGYATLDEVNLIAAEGDVALDTCTVGGANAPFVTLLFANGTVINGDIELKGGNVEIRGENAGTAKLVDAGIGDGIIRRWNSTIAAPTAYYWAPGEDNFEFLKKLYEVKPATAGGLTVKVYTNGVEVAGPRYLVLPNSLVTNIYATTGTYYFTNGTRTVTTELTVATDPTQDTVMDVWDSGWHCVDDYEGDDTEKIYQAAIADGFSENIATRLSRSGVKGYEHFCKWANVGVKGQQYSVENLKNATNLLFKAAYLQPWDRNLDDWGKWSPWLQGAEIYPSWPKPNPTYFYPTNYVDEAYGATGKELSIYSYWMLYGEATSVDGKLKSNELFWNSIGCKSALNGSNVLTETSGVARVTFVNVTNNAFKAIFIPKWDPEKEEPPKSFIIEPIFY